MVGVDQHAAVLQPQGEATSTGAVPKEVLQTLVTDVAEGIGRALGAGLGRLQCVTTKGIDGILRIYPF